MSQIDPFVIGMSHEQRARLRKLAWDTLRRFVLSASAAVGAKVGEHIIDLVIGDDEDDDEDDDDKETS